jgi:hypothetical protein
MKRHILILAVIMTLVTYLGAEKYPVVKHEDIQKTLSFSQPSGAKEVRVDNIFGTIKVEGYSGRDVQLKVHKTVKARNQERYEKALEEVTLDITEDNNVIDLYVNGPFRCEDKRSVYWKKDPRYRVQYDFELMVPYESGIQLKTVTEGDITVSDVKGDFEVHNVNGKILMQEMSGSGTAHTVNGEVKVTFTQNPNSDCSFKTMNGDLDIYFKDNLSADFRLKTFNGDILSDFPVTYLPFEPGKGEHKDGKFVFKSSRFFGVRTGKGGPNVKLDAFNGDILINKK